MLNLYLSSHPRYRPAIVRAHLERSRLFRALGRKVARALVRPVRAATRRLDCRRARRRAVAELEGLDHRTLKDIGVVRSEIPSLVRAAMSTECGGAGDPTRARPELAPQATVLAPYSHRSAMTQLGQSGARALQT